MKNLRGTRLLTIFLLLYFTGILVSSCDRSSSPEGRMSIQVENLKKDLIDSLRLQNQAIRDSLGKMRSDIQNLQQKLK